MTTPEEREKAIIAATGLTEAMREVAKRITDLDAYGKRNRKLIRRVITITVIVVAVILAAGMVASNLQERYACGLTNQQRTQEVLLWDKVITLSQPPPHASAQQLQQYYQKIRVFHSYLVKTFAPRNCGAIYRY